MTQPLMHVQDLWKEYPSGDGVVAVLKGLNLSIQAGELVAIIGASGSGKSTLMNILGCLDRPTRGNYTVAGQRTGGASGIVHPELITGVGASAA